MGSAVSWGLLCLVLIGLCIETVYAEDYYATLGLSRTASQKEIKKAFRDLSKKWHPDKNKENAEEAADMYARINNAYNVLNDEEKRRIYDQYGEEGLNRQNQPRGHNPFADLFGFNRGGTGAENMRRGPSLTLPIFVELKDLYLGKELRVANRKNVLCTQCRGSGAKNVDDVKKCPVCDGKGVKITKRQLGPGFVQQMQTTCDKCGGKGSIATSKCPHCHGTKMELGEDEMYVLIEKGMPDGHQIRFSQAGDVLPDTIPGDINFVVVTLEHPLFTRDGDNLRYKMTISLLEALVGFETTIEHLDGHLVPIRRDQITTPGLVLVINNEGMPLHEFPSQRGKLYIEFTVEFPSAITEEQKEGFRALL